MVDAREVEAERIVALVLALTAAVPAVIAAPSEDEAVRSEAVVFTSTTAAIEDEAVESVLAVDAVPAAMAAASEVEARLVLAFTAEVIPEVWVLVLAFTTAAIDDEAVRMDALVLALTAEVPEVTSDWRASVPESSVPSERRRVAYDQTSEAVMEPEVSVRVPFVQTSAAKVPKVVKLRALLAQTPVGMVDAREVEAERTSESVAKEPESRDAPVNVRVVLLHTSETNVPKELSVLDVLDHIEFASVVVETSVAPTTNDLSNLTKSPLRTFPQAICVGQIPSGPIEGMV